MSVPGGAARTEGPAAVTGDGRASGAGARDATGAAPAPASPFQRLRVASDRVPTKWFAAVGTGLFLAATAAFGGLADAPTPPVASLAIGEKHTSPQISLEVQEVVLLDELPALLIGPEPGERIVAVLVHATNEWTRPQHASLTQGDIRDLVRLDIDGLRDAAPAGILRIDDSLANPILQPDLRVPLAFAWIVPEAALSDGSDVVVQVFDHTFTQGSVVTARAWWGDPVLAATVDATAADLELAEEGG